MSTSVLKAMPGKLDIKRHSPGILYLSATSVLVCAFLRLDLINCVHLIVLLSISGQRDIALCQ